MERVTTITSNNLPARFPSIQIEEHYEQRQG